MLKDVLNNNEEVTPNSKEIAILKEHFPSCFQKDGSFDLERFKGFLNDRITITNEGYELKFLGKNYARLLASLDTTTVIKPNEEHNSKPENKNSENIYISGDNLDGLKHLLKSYSGKIKCIYIDPPYNTGGDGFVYNDKFDFSVDSLSEKLSVSEEQAERILDLTRRGSASHSAWLMFMYPRLILARDLLTNDGVIFISIDDNECHNLKLLCDDVFGEENLIATLPTVMNLKGNQDEFGFAGTHEYTIAYARKKEDLLLNEFEIDEDELEEWEVDEYGYYKRGANLKATGVNAPREKRPNLWFPIYVKDEKWSLDYFEGSQEILPLTDGREMSWRWSKNKFREEHYNVIINVNGDSVSIYKKQRPSLGDLPSRKPKTIFYKPEYSSGNGTNEVKDILGGKMFSNPKPLKLISDLLEIGCAADSMSLDFFSGSATTAHAVMKLNVQDGGNRKYIMVQLPERVKEKSEAENAGYRTVDQIGMDRIVKAAAKIKEENPDTNVDLGFKHFVLEEPTANTLDKIEIFDPDNLELFADKTLLEEFGKSTILATWLTRDGYGLSVEPEELGLSGYTGYFIGKHLYLIDAEIPNGAIEDLVVRYETDGNFNAENIVLFGYSFTWREMEQLKINLKRIKNTEKNLNINFDVRY